MRASFLFLFALAVSFGSAFGASAQQAVNTYPLAVLQGLDKITARVIEIEIPVGEAVKFGTLIITPRICHKRPPTETPESTIFLEVDDQQVGEEPRPVFRGWMFASSPGLNALEHPVYDVWALDCRNASISADSSDNTDASPAR